MHLKKRKKSFKGPFAKISSTNSLSLNSAKKSQAPPPKGKNQQTTPKNSSTSSASRSVSALTQDVPVYVSPDPSSLTVSNHRSSGKKATPPNTASGGKAVARPGSRVSPRVSYEILRPHGNGKTSPGQREPRKKPPSGNNQSGSSKHLPTAGSTTH